VVNFSQSLVYKCIILLYHVGGEMLVNNSVDSFIKVTKKIIFALKDRCLHCCDEKK